MKVSELIAALQEQDPEMEVVVSQPTHNYLHQVVGVRDFEFDCVYMEPSAYMPGAYTLVDSPADAEAEVAYVLALG